MKTLELTGLALNYAVAVALNRNPMVCGKGVWSNDGPDTDPEELDYIDWAQAGPLFDEAGIDITLYLAASPTQYKAELDWAAANPAGGIWWARAYGPNRLTAGLRCLVRSKLGDEVDIPKELTC